MTYGLEVSECTGPEWRSALSAGLGAMLALWRNGGGTLLGDLDTHTLEYRPP